MSASAPTSAALIVTSNSARWIEQTLASIVGQEHQPDAIVVIDDNSTDTTRSIVHAVLGGRASVYRATSRADDVTTRIAHNFHQGIRACLAYDVAVLGDHDDLWYPTRVGHQVRQFAVHPEVTMLASDGTLINARDESLDGTLRATFPVPGDWNHERPAEQMRYAVRHSIATGGASALRPSGFADLTIPAGWLHDRWWSLVATARRGMMIDTELVIDYRVIETQEVGLGRGRQDDSRLKRLTSAVTGGPEVMGKLRDLHGRLRPLATDDAIGESLSWARLIQALR
jgi:glycosyltransferase involved in cell wall biosynthesis